jgi:hypothetical protein
MADETQSKFYIYLHINVITGEPFYIGKGCGNRSIQKTGRNNYWHKIVNKYGYDIIKIENNLTNSEANEKEIYWIKRIGRKDLDLGPLVNFTDGGEGGNGYKHTQDAKDRLSIIKTGNYDKEKIYDLPMYIYFRKGRKKCFEVSVKRKHIGSFYTLEEAIIIKNKILGNE